MAALAAAALLLHLVLIQPNHPDAMAWNALFLFPLELPVMLLALIALPAGARLTQGLRLLLVAVLMVIALAKLADYGTFIAFNRGFNAVVDYNLIHAAWVLGSGSIGTPLAALAVAGALLALALVAWALWWATGRWARLRPPPALALVAGLALVPATGLAVGEIGQAMRAWSMPFQAPGAAFTARVGIERVALWRETLSDLRDFRRAATEDPYVGRQGLLSALDGRDVQLIYVESYGRSSFENPLYRPTHAGTLRAAEPQLAAAGLGMRSGWLTAPMVGGQSWLAHGSVASGLWTDNQGRYRAMIASPRRTLFHFAAQAGYRTAAVMPAITMAWPEAGFFGFDAIHAAADLGYRGLPFNWVTMPDQFTLSAFDRLEREVADRPPLFAQIALISSHAPWVPVPDLVPWDAVGDGTVFNAMAQAGDPPDVVWRDHDRVREQYRLAIDYTLRTVTDYAARVANDAPLMIVLGDHQAARFVSGTQDFDVPIHVIGPPELVERFAAWGFAEGLIPDPSTPALRMDAFRDRFLETFTDGES
ncbi:sulfatase [Halovulum dunhuangense]|uniref:Sulfatase n=1 Tax=Halovulum dunhuangense TaxID=1505036 RepID=A0A849L077_9RHOB|nr:sulfatase [Halovulum dunhuangense]